MVLRVSMLHDNKDNDFFIILRFLICYYACNIKTTLEPRNCLNLIDEFCYGHGRADFSPYRRRNGCPL